MEFYFLNVPAPHTFFLGSSKPWNSTKSFDSQVRQDLGFSRIHRLWVRQDSISSKIIGLVVPAGTWIFEGSWRT